MRLRDITEAGIPRREFLKRAGAAVGAAAMPAKGLGILAKGAAPAAAKAVPWLWIQPEFTEYMAETAEVVKPLSGLFQKIMSVAKSLSGKGFIRADQFESGFLIPLPGVGTKGTFTAAGKTWEVVGPRVMLPLPGQPNTPNGSWCQCLDDPELSGPLSWHQPNWKPKNAVIGNPVEALKRLWNDTIGTDDIATFNVDRATQQFAERNGLKPVDKQAGWEQTTDYKPEDPEDIEAPPDYKLASPMHQPFESKLREALGLA